MYGFVVASNEVVFLRDSFLLTVSYYLNIYRILNVFPVCIDYVYVPGGIVFICHKL